MDWEPLRCKKRAGARHCYWKPFNVRAGVSRVTATPYIAKHHFWKPTLKKGKRGITIGNRLMLDQELGMTDKKQIRTEKKK